jgi:regulatory protein
MRRSGSASSADRTAASSEGRAARDPRSALLDLKRRLAALQTRDASRIARLDEEAASVVSRTERSQSREPTSNVTRAGRSETREPASNVARAERSETREPASNVARVERSETRDRAEGAVKEPSRPDSDTSKPDPYRQALGLLVRREHSRAELQRKLRARGADPHAATTALQTLREQGYQDDARFAEMLIRTRINGGYGPLHIRAELGTHRIDPETAQQALLEAAPDWGELAIRALQRRYGTRVAADRPEKLKRGQFLQRRGFDAASIRFALEAAACG